MPAVVGRDDPLKKYWWAALALVFIVAGWVSLPLIQGRWEDSAGSSGQRLQSSEQSLDSLEAASNPDGAPGGPLAMEGQGSYRRKPGSTQISSLYEPVGGVQAAGAPIAEGEGKGVAAGEGGASLGAALDKLAKASRRADKGWGAESAQAGFRPPRATFGALGSMGSGGGGGGSSMASAPASGPLSFGSGAGGPGGGAAALGGSAGSPFVIGRRKTGNQAFNALQSAEALAGRAAASGSAERAAGLGGQTYDASKSRGTLSQIGGGGGNGGAVVGSLESVPDNLKVSDPKLSKRELEPPKIPEPKKVEDKSLEMEKMITQMLLQAAIGGVLGPVFGGMGAALAGGLGLPATSGGYSGYSGSGSRITIDGQTYVKQ